MFQGNFRVAVSSLRSARWRSFLTMLGIIIGVSSVIIIVSLGEGLKKQITGQINQLGGDVLTVRSGKVLNRDSDGSANSINPLAFLSTSTLNDQDIDALSKLPSVKAVAPLSFVTNSVSGDGHEVNNAFVIGSTPDIGQTLNQKIAYGSLLTNEDQGQNYSVIGPTIAAKLFGELNPVGKSMVISGNEFIVRGVFESFTGGALTTTGADFNTAVFIPYNIGKQITGGKAQIMLALVRAADPKHVAATKSDITSTLTATHQGQTDFTALDQDDLQAVTDNSLRTVTRFITGIAAISLIVGGIGIMNIMLVSVSERTREIGVRKAIGATNRQIWSQFLMEGMVLSITGGLLGILLSLAVIFGLRVGTDFKPSITLPIIFIAVGASVTIGIIFSVAPALKAARKDPIRALRGE